MNINFDFSDNVTKENYEPMFFHFLNETLNELGFKGEDIFVSLSIVDDKMMHELNRTYRGVDKTTDVLSFAFEEGDDKIVGMRELGEIYISYQTALKQSPQYHMTCEEEMCFLFVHGILHLCGYDHDEEEKKKIMFSLQEKIYKGADEKWKKQN